jgi:DnaJ-class molecular chaperone
LKDDFTHKELKKAYWSLAKINHPDANVGESDADRELRMDNFEVIKKAYEGLVGELKAAAEAAGDKEAAEEMSRLKADSEGMSTELRNSMGFIHGEALRPMLDCNDALAMSMLIRDDR